ncbi:MAG: AraC family transcriptional regulator [Kiritimatiellae bacterium]|nr:AraC family transcriptional regulator [Kiritimatiellia bacterium]
MTKPFAEVFWGVKGRGSLVIDGVEMILPPEHIAIYLPGMVHEFTAIDEDWEMRWWTMDGPLTADIMTGMGLNPGVFEAGPAPIELFDQLEEAIRDPSPLGERRASALAFELLTLTHGLSTAAKHDALVNEILGYLTVHWAEHDLSVTSLAHRFHVHRSTLARRFQAALGTPPVDYIITMRIQNAMSLLQQTSNTVAEIAHQCGFSEPNYFARLFRNRTGYAPLEFRKQEH